MAGELYRGYSGGSGLYPEILELLRKIAAGTGGTDGSSIHEYGQLNEWVWERKGNSYFYDADITLAGATQTVNLPLGRIPMKLNRISMIFNSANPRTFSTRIYPRPDVAYYETIDYQLAHTSDSRVMNYEYKYVPHMISFLFSAYTAADIVSIEVQVDAL